MEIVYDDDELETFVRTAAEASPDHPVLVDRFLEGAIEVDVDAVADAAGDVFIGAVMEHIEEAGVHSGDSSCQIPPATLSDDELDTIEDIARRLARRLGVVGLLNLQLAVKDERIWVLEANPRASRTVPFVSKVIGVSLAGSRRWCSRAGRSLDLGADGVLPADPHHYRHLPYTSVKAAVLPFGRFPGVDTVLGPEMKSTGEVMGIDADPGWALAKAFSAGGAALPERGHRVRQRGQPGQALDRVPGQAARRSGVPIAGDRRDRGRAPARRDPGRAGREGERARRERRRADPRWHGRSGHQHPVRPRSAHGRLLHPDGLGRGRRAVHHHAAGGVRGGPGHRGAARPVNRAAFDPGVPCRGHAGADASTADVRSEAAAAGSRGSA